LNAVYARVKKFFADLKKQIIASFGRRTRRHYPFLLSPYQRLSKAEIREIPMPNCAVFEETL
jgi:hypothetical protein